MRIMRFLLLLLSVLACQILSAQEYQPTRKKGIDMYNKGELQEAAKFFKAAKFCPDLPSDNDLDAWLEKCVITVRLSENRLEFGAVVDDEQFVEVITKAKSFKVSGAPEWCTVTPQAKFVYVHCDDNDLVEPREAKITITAAGKTAILDVYQASADLEVVFVPDSVVFSSHSDSLPVRVVSNVTDWTVESSPSWLVAERRSDDTLMLACEKNTLPDVRQVDLVIVVSEEQFKLHVAQLPGDTVLQVNKKELVVRKDYSEDVFAVRCNMDNWSVSTNESWLDVERKNDSVMVFVQENPSLFSRHGKIRVSCGTRRLEVVVHQSPHTSTLVLPESELKGITDGQKETIKVTSIPSDLVVYVDDSTRKITPFEYYIDYEHHSLLVGRERREFLFNEKQQDISFEPGLRFAAITFTAPKNIGLRTGFISANGFGAYSHFQASRPLIKEFMCDTLQPSGYHFMVGPVYSPIQYAALYGGIGVGIHEGPSGKGLPNVGLDYEAGVMGLFKNMTMSFGFRTTRWGENDSKRTTFVFGIGGYLKRYYDTRLGYCTSDSRRWWSLNYMTRPAVNGKGLMVGDMGKEKARTYLKALYVQPNDSLSRIDASFGFVFTPVNGAIDFCIGAGGGFDVIGSSSAYPTLELEAGFIMNLWRVPLTVMFHESDVITSKRHLYVDFGIGFHLGEFKRSSFK